MQNRGDVFRALMFGNAAILNEVLQGLNSTERISVLTVQDYTDNADESNALNSVSPPIIAVQSDLDCVKAGIEGQGDIFEFLDKERVSLSLTFKYRSCTHLFVVAAIKRKT